MSKSVLLYNQHHDWFYNIFITPKKDSVTTGHHNHTPPLPLPQPLATPPLPLLPPAPDNQQFTFYL